MNDEIMIITIVLFGLVLGWLFNDVFLKPKP